MQKTKAELQKEIQELTSLRDMYEFKRKTALRQDYFFDADRHEYSRDLVQEDIDKLRKQLDDEDKEIKSSSSNYIQCLHCYRKVHQNRLHAHKCSNTPVTRRRLHKL